MSIQQERKDTQEIQKRIKTMMANSYHDENILSLGAVTVMASVQTAPLHVKQETFVSRYHQCRPVAMAAVSHRIDVLGLRYCAEYCCDNMIRSSGGDLHASSCFGRRQDTSSLALFTSHFIRAGILGVHKFTGRSVERSIFLFKNMNTLHLFDPPLCRNQFYMN